MNAKYIVYDTGMFVTGIIFSAAVNHVDIAAVVKGEILGAGFVRMDTKAGEYENIADCSAYGESIGLKVKSRGDQDSEVLNRMLNVNKD